MADSNTGKLYRRVFLYCGFSLAASLATGAVAALPLTAAVAAPILAIGASISVACMLIAAASSLYYCAKTWRKNMEAYKNYPNGPEAVTLTAIKSGSTHFAAIAISALVATLCFGPAGLPAAAAITGWMARAAAGVTFAGVGASALHILARKMSGPRL